MLVRAYRLARRVAAMTREFDHTKVQVADTAQHVADTAQQVATVAQHMATVAQDMTALLERVENLDRKILAEGPLTEGEVVAAYRVFSGETKKTPREARLVDNFRKYKWDYAGLFLTLIELPMVRERLNLPAIATALYTSRVTCPVTTHFGAKLFGYPTDYFVYKAIEKSGSWEPHVEKCIREHVQRGDCVLDIGANIGYFSALFAELVGAEGLVDAFEPMPHLYSCLEKMREANGFGNLELHAVALGDRDADVSLELNYVNAGGNKIVADNLRKYPPHADTRYVQCQMRSLDSMMSKFTRRISFIKMDIEGAEPLVISGAADFLREHSPKMLIEFAPAHLKLLGRDPNAMLRELCDLDYRITTLSTGSNSVAVDADSADRLCEHVEEHHSYVELFAEPSR
jgi:FkbM family methyltransferase